MRRVLLLGVLFGICLVWGVEGNVEVDVDGFVVDVTTNEVPKYTFSNTNESRSVYSVFFHALYEAKNSSGSYKKDGKSQTSLPSLDWDFTTPEHEEIDNSTCVVFNISATDSDKKFNSFDCLTFINRICSDNSSHDTSLKFDIDLSGYQWLNDDSDYVLAIVFSLKGNKGNGTSLRRDDSNFIVEFGENGYFNTTDEALTGEYRNISTAVDADLQGQKITLYFDHFSQNLFQDPAFGLKEGHHGSNGDIGLIVGVTIGGFVGIVVVIAIVIVGVVLIKKKGLKYTTVQ